MLGRAMSQESESSKSTGAFTTAQQEIWKNRIRSELGSVKEWESNWGFLVERKAEQTAHPTQKSVLREEVKSVVKNAQSVPEKRIV